VLRETGLIPARSITGFQRVCSVLIRASNSSFLVCGLDRLLGAMTPYHCVISKQRLTGRWAQIPTAVEQGYDIHWPIISGLYMGKSVGIKEQREWIDALNQAAVRPNFAAELANVGMQPAWYVGADLESLIEKQMIEYRRLAIEFGVMR
jgi:putative tricarboxylic transport membrane protein